VLTASFFDGRSTRVRTVVLSAANGELIVQGPDVDLHVPIAAVQVDERLGARHGDFDSSTAASAR